MKISKKLLMGLTIIIFCQFIYANETNVAKVVIMKGQVRAKLVDQSIVEVKIGQAIPEGATLQTSEKSFVKLIFIDKSQMNLGPNSQMVITAFPKNEAGIITLVKGQIRSQVTKDYMEMDDKNKSKLYIKTKTAAMGIRGTDFQVNFNPENQNTALITFEGKVVMAHIEKNSREDQFNQRNLENIVSSDKAVMVERGQISAVNLNVAERAMVPTLLGTKQIEALKENETGVKESSEAEKKQYRNALPPGVDSSIFSNITKDNISENENSPKSDPNGFFNIKTGEYKLPAGSIVDLNTVNIIPPPTNAVFDPNSKTYIVPESFGNIDKSTGEYRAPEGLKLRADGTFILVDKEAYFKSQVINKEDKKEENKENKSKEVAPGNQIPPEQGPENRAPASTEVAPPPAASVPKIFDSLPSASAFINTNSQNKPPPPPENRMTDAQRAAASDRISTTETVRQENTNRGSTNPTSRVRFIFNAQ
jgi:hypothetical protein